MIFTGSSLARIRGALELAKSELHNMVATCPDVNLYSEEIEEYEEESAAIQKLCDRIDLKHPELKPE